MWEKKRGFTSHGGVLLPSEPVPQNISIKLPKADDNDREHKNDNDREHKNDVNTLS